MIDKDKIVIQLSVWFDGESYETTIQGLNGYFDIEHMRAFFNAEQPYFGYVYKELDKQYGRIEEAFYSVYADVVWQDSETQYGTGYGDILTLPGYYHIGNTLEIIKHEYMGEQVELELPQAIEATETA